MRQLQVKRGSMQDCEVLEGAVLECLRLYRGIVTVALSSRSNIWPT